MKLIICEKPSLASEFAKVLNAKVRNGYYESEEYLITSVCGHLYELANVEDYIGESGKRWSLDILPFIPEPFKWKEIKSTKKYVNVLKQLLPRATCVIDAMDYDREAELIFYELVTMLDIKIPIKRLLLTSHTEKDVLKGLSNLSDRMINLEKAAVLRAKIDWIPGINMTRAFTIKCGGKVTLPVGRVILPTLNLVYMREKEIENFVPAKFYKLEVEFKTEHGQYVGKYFNTEGIIRFDSESAVRKTQAELLGKPFEIVSKDVIERDVYPGSLFSLSELQKEITNKHKEFTSAKVLEIAQSLYESKFTTYPRTDSKHLDNSQTEDVKLSLAAVLGLSEYERYESVTEFTDHKRTFDSKKVSSHPALMPTDNVPDLEKLSNKEQIVYKAITERFISHFMGPARYEDIVVVTAHEEQQFKTKETALLSKGWKVMLESNQVSKKVVSTDENTTIDKLMESSLVTAEKIKIQTGKTTPPKKYTEGDLISEMVTCGSRVEDEEVLKGFTMGSASTRANVISKLISNEYIKKSGLNVSLTELGKTVMEVFPIRELLDVTFTGRIEKILKGVEDGLYSDEEFMSKMNSFFIKSINQLKESDLPIIEKKYESIGMCPACKSNVLDKEKIYGCENKECKFYMAKDNKFFNFYQKKLTKAIAKKLLKDKKVMVKGIISPYDKKNPFDDFIQLTTKEDGTCELKIDHSKRKKGE